MSEEIFRIKSIRQFHDLIGFEKPKHPLISIIDVSKVKLDSKWLGKRFSTSLYSIALKDASQVFNIALQNFIFLPIISAIF